MSQKHGKEVILTTGRAVRLRRLTTAMYREAKEDANAQRGDLRDKPDPNNARMQSFLDRALVSKSLVAVTDEIDWEPIADKLHEERDAAVRAAKPDADVSVLPFNPSGDDLIGRLAPESWHTVRELDLIDPSSALHFDKLLESPADYLLMVALVSELVKPEKVCAYAGKARTVTT